MGYRKLNPSFGSSSLRRESLKETRAAIGAPGHAIERRGQRDTKRSLKNALIRLADWAKVFMLLLEGCLEIALFDKRSVHFDRPVIETYKEIKSLLWLRCLSSCTTLNGSFMDDCG